MMRVLTAALPVVMSTGLLAAGATAAHAQAPAQAPTIRSITVRPATVVLTSRANHRISFTVVVDGARRVRAQVNPVGKTGGPVSMLRPAGAPGVWVGSGALNWIDDPGTYDLRVTAQDEDGDDAEGHRRFLLRRGTRFGGFGAAPSTVRRGQAIKVSGRLNALDFRGRWGGYRAGRVGIYFQRQGSGVWTRRAVVVTDRNGKFLRSFRATASGLWMARFDGNGIWYKSASRRAGVTVR